MATGSTAPRSAAFLLGLSGVAFQLALTRLSSAALNYHLTFLAISAAMLGSAAGGVWIAGWFPPASAGDLRIAGRLSVLAASLQSVTLAAFAWAPLGSLGALGVLLATGTGMAVVTAAYAASGAALALLLRQSAPDAGGTYAADLAGATAGCALGFLTMQLAGPPWAAAGAALAASAAAVPLSAARGRLLALSTAVWLLAVAAAIGAFRPNVLGAKPLATYLDPARYPDSVVEMTRWDSFARIDVFAAPGAMLLWEPGTGRTGDLPDLRGITLDGDALTAAVHLEPGESLPSAEQLPASLPYLVARRDRVLVIGPGGGVDVAAALRFGARSVDAVEVSPAMVNLLHGPLRAFTGGLYERPGVRLVQAEGRAYLRGSTQQYGAIVLTAVDSWAALTSGAYSLAESYLYTPEAIGEMYDHLSVGGVIAISRWFTRPPREMERLAAIARAALTARGAPIERALLVQRAGDFGTLLLRREPFPAAEVERARAAARQNYFSIAYDPTAPRGEIAAAIEPQVDVSRRLPSDDRPHFFDFAPWGDVMAGAPLPRGHAVLLLALVESLCIAVAAIVLPLRRLRLQLPVRGQFRWAAYFGAIGVGFMAAELALLQRFTLLLGSPAASLAATLVALLAGAAFGSLLLRRIPQNRHIMCLAFAPGFLLAYSALLAPTAGAALSWPLAARVVLIAAVAGIPAIAMGVAFPAGLARVSATGAAVGDRTVPWAWGINGAASAIGAILTTMVAMEWGYRAVFVCAAACYAIAAGLLGRRAALSGFIR